MLAKGLVDNIKKRCTWSSGQAGAWNRLRREDFSTVGGLAADASEPPSEGDKLKRSFISITGKEDIETSSAVLSDKNTGK